MSGETRRFPFKILSSHRKPPASHKCSKWCGKAKCMCGKPIHVELLKRRASR